MRNENYVIDAHWQRRAESPRDLAERVRRYVSLARAHLPDDLDWYTRGEKLMQLCQTDQGMSKLECLIAKGLSRDEGIGCPEFGYDFKFFLAARDPAPAYDNCSTVRMSAGASAFQNHCIFYSDVSFSDKTDPRLITYDVMKAHMMAMVWAFQPSWCTAAPSRLFNYLDREPYVRPPIELAWMTWLEPALVRQMRPPPSYRHTIIEGYVDDSVFLATGKETFDVDIGQHLASARAIHRQLDHLNYIVPFEGMRGRSPRVPPFPDAPPATWNAWGDDQ